MNRCKAPTLSWSYLLDVSLQTGMPGSQITLKSSVSKGREEALGLCLWGAEAQACAEKTKQIWSRIADVLSDLSVFQTCTYLPHILSFSHDQNQNSGKDYAEKEEGHATRARFYFQWLGSPKAGSVVSLDSNNVPNAKLYFIKHISAPLLIASYWVKLQHLNTRNSSNAPLKWNTTISKLNEQQILNLIPPHAC